MWSLSGHGLKDKTVLVGLPGSHSKWARLENGVITTFKTFMTGELFELLTTHSILSLSPSKPATSSIDVAEPETDDTELAHFLDGVHSGHSRGSELAHLAFMTRTKALFNPSVSQAALRGYLSGVLIGAELCGAGVAAQRCDVWLVGNEKLCERYMVALEALGLKNVFTDTAEACVVSGALSILSESTE